MARYLPKFPDGAAGIGLFLLRMAASMVIVSEAATAHVARSLTPLPILMTGIVVLVLLAGMATRWVVTILCVLALVALPSTSQPIHLSGHFAAGIAMILLGPGAFSLDARLHGRSVVHLQAANRRDDETE